MVKRTNAWIVVAVLMVTQACSHQRTTDNRLLAKKENLKYNLTCLFYGQEVSIRGGEKTKGIDAIVVRDQRTGREVRFRPIDPESLYQSLGYYTDVWSPDEEFLVLPLGRFDGFAVLKSSEAMNVIATGKPNDFIRVQLDNGVRLWHKFDRWADRSSFGFQAGLSDDFASFRYSLTDRLLTVQSSNVKSMVGINSKGHLRLSSRARVPATAGHFSELMPGTIAGAQRLWR
jgi:hypothetical protein